MISRTLYGAVSLGEVYFDEPVNASGLDLVRFNQSATPVPKSTFEEFHTRLIDLAQPEDRLFAAVKKDTRTQIRRAEREAAAFELWEHPTELILSEFYGVFDEWAGAQDLPPANRSRIEACAKAGHLVVSRAEANLVADVWHAYYSLGTRARLLHSISTSDPDNPSSRQIAGRLNRFLHWSDIRWFKAKGLAVYDLGGWYTGSEDQKKLAINAFKAEFGGVVAREYNCLLPVSLFGRVICCVRNLVRRVVLKKAGI